MKKLIPILLLCSAIAGAQADVSKYEKAMKKNLSKIDDAKDVTSMLKVANGFERIAFAEKDQWLPYYYASLMHVLA